MRADHAFAFLVIVGIQLSATSMSASAEGPAHADQAMAEYLAGKQDHVFGDRFQHLIQDCADGAQCLVSCGDFSSGCVSDCTDDLPSEEANNLLDLQICAIQSCFYLGQCPLGDFSTPECVQCRLDVNLDPGGFGCNLEGMVCGI